MTDYSDDSIFPSRGLIPEVDRYREMKIREKNDVPEKLESEVSPGSISRLERIKALKGYTTNKDALDFCISMGWIIAENQMRTINTRKKPPPIH